MLSLSLSYGTSGLYSNCHSKDGKKNQFRLRSPEPPIGLSCLSKWQALAENIQEFSQTNFYLQKPSNLSNQMKSSIYVLWTKN